MPSLFQLHVQKWSSCTQCRYHETRQHVVLCRGKIPCEVLFIGEAPGESEDVVGIPFYGPAGNLLQEDIIDVSYRRLGLEPNYALTNIICCIPRDEQGNKEGAPGEFEVGRCRPRLQEFLGICKPKLIFTVGVEASKASPTWEHYAKVVEIPHPAWLIRKNMAIRGLEIQKVVNTLIEELEELPNLRPKKHEPYWATKGRSKSKVNDGDEIPF